MECHPEAQESPKDAQERPKKAQERSKGAPEGYEGHRRRIEWCKLGGSGPPKLSFAKKLSNLAKC